MKIRWLGHSSFLIQSGAVTVLVDPFLSDNPSFSENFLDGVSKIDAVVLTHGHGDHLGDVKEVVAKYGSKVFAIYEICSYLERYGITDSEPMNIGGTVELREGVFVSLVNAVHSSSMFVDGEIVYMGQPAGAVITTPDGVVYHSGDTDVFSDMALVQKLYSPEIALLPIGGRFTMSSKTAAFACNEFLDVEIAVPMHYGTFPIIGNDPDAFVARLSKAKGLILKAGEEFSFSTKKS